MTNDPETDESDTPTVSAVRAYIWHVLLTLGVLVITVLTVVHLVHHSAPAAHTTTATAAAQTPATPVAVAAPAPPPCTTNRSGNLIRVSVSTQHMWLCEGRHQISDSPVTTGSVGVGAGTPIGNWHIADHESDRYLSGPGYVVFVHYWLRIFGDIGFHDSPWQKFPYGDTSLYKNNGSHGCIHVPEPAMAKLYDWAGDGTKVSIVA